MTKHLKICGIKPGIEKWNFAFLDSGSQLKIFEELSIWNIEIFHKQQITNENTETQVKFYLLERG